MGGGERVTKKVGWGEVDILKLEMMMTNRTPAGKKMFI